LPLQRGEPWGGGKKKVKNREQSLDIKKRNQPGGGEKTRPKEVHEAQRPWKGTFGKTRRECKDAQKRDPESGPYLLRAENRFGVRDILGEQTEGAASSRWSKKTWVGCDGR